MIIFLGPPGAGKSLQGRILAIRHGWDWISAGAVLRQQKDPKIQEILQTGNLLPSHITNRLIAERLDDEKDLSAVVLDGFPRSVDQAESLLNYFKKRGNGKIEGIIVLDVGRNELIHRLLRRGRADDTPDAIETRLNVFATEGMQIIKYFEDHDVRVEHIMGNRSVGQVHDSIEHLVNQVL